jgi:putative OmpL-like beta-barrel porin-2
VRTRRVFIWEFIMQSKVNGSRHSSPRHNVNVGAFAVLLAFSGVAYAIDTTASSEVQVTSSDAAAPSVDSRITDLTLEVEDLKRLVHELEAQLPKRAPAPAASSHDATLAAAAPVTAERADTGAVPSAALSPPPKQGADFLRGLTINALLDTYYEYNTNSPIGRVNTVRAYDVSSNSFSLSQADVVLESAPDLSSDKRFGARIDLQFGQATAATQGNPANELRPDLYRNVYQAYGTYIFPVGQGLTVDFGKWASSLGIEGNYTKDQLNYSRSFWFDYLPFYHSGLRAKYTVNDVLAVNLWITNGTQQTEAFNNYKDQLLGVVLTPTPAITWTINHYQGQEHPDVVYLQNPTAAQLSLLPNQQGTAILPIPNAPDGKLQISDTYLSWQVTKSLILEAEADYVQERLYSYSTPQRVEGGALYAGYQISPQFAVAMRAEYLADIGGLFSDTTQYLKEGTVTFDYRPVDGFLLRGEFRRDESNQHYFLGNTLGVLQLAQPTIGFGVVWWFGQKEGSW